MTASWPSIPLRDVLIERQETPCSSSIQIGETRIISKIGFDSGQIDFRTETQTKTKMIEIQPGDLVLSGINAAKGAIAIYPDSEEFPAAATIHYGAYQVNDDKADKNFLWWLLRSNSFRDILERNLPGGIKTELKAKRLLPIEIPLPPLSEQRRIVAKIERLAGKVEEAKGFRWKSNLAAEQVVDSALVRIFQDESNADWTDGCLGDYVVDDCYGTSEKSHDEPIGNPILRMGNIQNGNLDVKDLKYLHIEEKNRKKWILRSGDILVNRTNSAELVGKCAVFDLDGQWGFASYLIRLRLDQNMANPYLVAKYINSSLGRDYMFRERKQMTGQANVNAKKLKALPIKLPSIDQQQAILERLNDLQKRVDGLRALQAKTATELDAMLPSILDRAFKGEL